MGAMGLYHNVPLTKVNNFYKKMSVFDNLDIYNNPAASTTKTNKVNVAAAHGYPNFRKNTRRKSC